ncbi:helix-turn-helix domain-containing protein [Streptomyces sp. NBC_00582]|uniref:helix-turn-helix domain-containing protein n=1 Tax=Streptomyces sp. NBC_00582 TaxID=2975783 RepID=UPI002E810E94|nr:helix-turn-helix domain-containing protein [Streptomyces sp. NBC_00582]WUB64506.1 PucR family transcriptional regulator [Streptomyces sp. NBC_00582]
MSEKPAVPLTPPVPLAALLARDDLALRQIAGPADADTVLHGAHTSEMADPYPYLLGGELLLTAGVHIPEAAGSGTYFDDYVARIVAGGGAALGFGVAPVHDTVPRALVAACETHGLPLVEVPPRTTFATVARAVWQLMERARTAELRRVTEAQQSLASAAARPDPVPSVLRRLASRIGGRAVLYGPEGTQIATAGPAADTDDALSALAHRLTARGSSTASDTTPTGAHLTAYALSHDFVLTVATPTHEPGDHTIASVAAVLLTLLTGTQETGSATARTSALVRLLLGATPEEVTPLLATGDRWLVVHASPSGRREHPRPGARGTARAATTHPQPPDRLAVTTLAASLGSPLVDLRADVVRVLVPADRTPGPHPDWTFGVSDEVPAHHLATADAQASRALARARATRTPLARHSPHRSFASLLPPEDARALLAPLGDTPALKETLRTWLSLHGSWDRTAVALSVHRNTVRQRMARCAALLGTDLDDPDVRMELWFALRVIDQ